MLAAVPQAEGDTMAYPLSSLSAGSSPLRAGADSGNEAGSEPSLLQELINNALNEVTGTLEGVIAVALKKNVIYTGDVTISDEGRTVGNDFVLELAAEDAGEDGMQADGSILFDGTMLIKNIAVTIKGVGLRGAVSVQDAKLNYYGTAKDDDVNVTAAGSATAVDIQTGDGADNVNVQARSGALLTVDTGADSDKVKAVVTGGSKAGIKTGVGDDTVSLKTGAGTVAVNTGSGDDTLSVIDLGGDGDLSLRTGKGNDTVTLTGQAEDGVEPAGSIDVELGEGMDEAIVDLSIAAAAQNVAVKGAEGSDRLHVTGYLDKNVAADLRASGTEEDMVLVGTQGTLHLTADSMESVTDDLKNKRTVIVAPALLGELNYVATDGFTNYIYTGAADMLSKLTVTTEENKKLPLSSFVIDARTALTDGTTVEIKENAELTVKGLQLALRGKDVVINGKIAASLVRAEAYSATTANVPMVNLYITKFPVDLLNISDKASVRIGKNAEIYSEGDILLQAKTDQDSGIITLMPGMNVIDLKLTEASVDVNGKLYAGYDLDKKERNGARGSVSITAATNTTAGIDENGAAYNGLPFAITMAKANAKVNIGKDAQIDASDSIHLSSKTRLEVSSRADSTNGLPVAVAITVLTDNAKTTVNGTLSADKDVILSSSGDVDVTTIADKGEGQKGSTGGYLGAAVVLQHVKAEAADTAQITAGGDVTVQSSAREKAETRAESGMADKESKEDNAIVQIINGLGDLWDTAKGLVGLTSEEKKELDEAVAKVSVSDHAVYVDESAKASGDVKVDTSTNDGKVTVNVNVKPMAGYIVKSITWRGLNPGDTSYTTGTAVGKDSCSFTQSTKDITVFVEYEEDGTIIQEEEEEIDPDLFEDKEENQQIDIREMVENITDSTDDVSTEKSGINPEDRTVPLTLTGSGGGVLTYETEPDDPAQSLKKVAPGEELRLVVNPEEGRLLKNGGLKATYKGLENGVTVEKTVIVNPDDDDYRYFLTIPETIVAAAGVSVKAEFVDDGRKDVDAGDRGLQMAGAIAVAVTTNDNRAVIDGSATVTAGGDTTVSADGATDVDTVADGTAITSKTPSEIEAFDEDAIVRTEAWTYTDTQAQTENGVPHTILIHTDAVKNAEGNIISGDIIYKNSISTGEAVTGYAFSAAPNTKNGFALDGNLSASWEDENGAEHRRVLEKKNDLWILDASDIPENAQITVSGGFKEDLHSYSTFNDPHGRLILHDEQVRAGDHPFISIVPDAGYTAEKVTIEFLNPDGTAAGAPLELTVEDRNGDKLGFDVPELASGVLIHISAEFKQKTIMLTTGDELDVEHQAEHCTLSEKYGAESDIVTVTAGEANLQEGFKVVHIKVTDDNDVVVYEGDGDSFTIPQGTPDSATLTISAALGEKEIVLNEAQLDHGNVIPVYARADRGETVKVKIDPNDDYRIRQGTLKAVITAKDGSYTEEVYMDRKSDFLYTFIMPTGINPASVEINFTGEFEKGQSGEGVTTNLGASLAVTVANSHNRADIKGIVSSDSIRALAFGEDSVRTESMAGYSSGTMGIGGAVSVQVASVDSKARVHDSAVLSLDTDLAVEAEDHVALCVDADGSGSKRQSKGMGIGIGLAVAVNGADTVAAVQDKAILKTRTAGETIDSITIRAEQTVQDTVSGAAGASGRGTSLAAVGAVDIVGTSATAYMGQLFGNKMLNVQDDVTIRASNLAEHFVEAEGASTGIGTGIGAAIGGSLVTDVAKASLAQNLNAGSLTVASATESTVQNIANASGAGGRVPYRLGFTDSILAKLAMAVAKLAAISGNYYITEDQLDFMLKYRLRILTTEGTMGMAAAVTANLQKSRSISEIKDGVNVDIAGRMNVISENRTEAVMKANGSTVDSVTGIGAGAALNLVDIKNIARVGTGKVNAGSLNVYAVTREKSPEYTGSAANVNSQEDLENLVRETVGDYVSDLVNEIGLAKLLAGDTNLLKNIGSFILDDLTSEIMDSGELFDFVSDIDILGAVRAVLNEEKMHTIGDRIAIPVIIIFCLFVEVPVEEIDKYRENFTNTFERELVGTLDEEFRGMLSGIVEAVLNKVIPIRPGSAGISKKEDSDLREDLKSEIRKMSGNTFKKALDKAVKKSLESLKLTADQDIDDILDELDSSGFLSEHIGMDDVLELYKYIKGDKKVKKDDGAQQSPAGDSQSPDAGSGEGMSLTDFINKLLEEITDSICKSIDMENSVNNLVDMDIPGKVSGSIIRQTEENNILLNDEQLAILRDPTDLRIETQKESYGSHLIDTQAISGAGARNMGIAGSAAVTNLKAVTRAEIANDEEKTETTDEDGKTTETTIDIPGGTVTVAGDMHVIADEKRLVNNVASAALNAKGNAIANTSAGEEANMDVGTSDDVQSVTEGKNVRITVGLGGSAEIPESEITKERPLIRINLKPGFTLETDKKTGKSYVSYSYNDGSGYEITGEKIEVKKDAKGWYIDTADLTELKIDPSVEVFFELDPVEILTNVPAPKVTSEVPVEQDAVTVGVKNREVVGDKLSARVGDVVTITVKKAKGRRLDTIGFTYKDANGTAHTAEINPTTSAPGHEKVYSMITTNKDEYVYSFRMPDGQLTDIDVHFVKGDEADADQGPYSNFRLSTDGFTTNGTGRGIGMGASFAMVTGSSDVEAVIGWRGDENEGVKAGNLVVDAASEHEETVASVAGTDPLSGSSTAADGSHLSLDASGAVNMLDNSIKAEMYSLNNTVVTGYKDGDVHADGDLSVSSFEEGESNVIASAFNVGLKTAVGATVALNMYTSDISTKLGSVDVNGIVSIASDSRSKDYTSAVASAVGQDVVRVLRAVDVDEDGSAKPKKEASDDNSDNNTGSDINKRLNQNKEEDGEDADNDMPLSMNVLRSQGVEMNDAETEEENKSTWEEVQDGLGIVMTGVALGYDVYNFFMGSKYQVAASVGMTKASHAAKVSAGSVQSGGAISITADNDGNFATLGTSAAASILINANSISGGAAITQSSNKAVVDVKGDLVSGGKGDITVKSTLTQNMAEDFADRMTAQSLSGALSGPKSTFSVGGAVSVVKSSAESSVFVDGGSEKKRQTIKGGNISIESTDKSRLNGRAGGVSLSFGDTVGIGASIMVLKSGNKVSAKIGDYANIEGNSLTVSAEKQAVTGDDYKNLLAMRDKEDNDDLINVKESEDKKENEAKVNIYASKVQKAFEGINKYTFLNNYAEALSGSAKPAWGGASIAGTLSVVHSRNKVDAGLGSNMDISLTEDKEKDGADGHMTIKALSDANTRVIAGSLSAGASAGTAGATISVTSNKDKVNAVIGDMVNVNKAGDVTQKADVAGKAQVFTGAAGVAALAKDSSNAFSATLNVVKIGSEANATVGDNSYIKSRGKASVTSNTKLDLTSIGVNAVVSVAGLSGGGLAAGGTLSVIHDRAAANTKLGDHSSIDAKEDIDVSSDISDQMIAGVASQAAAFSKGVGVAAGFNVVSSASAAKTTLGGDIDLYSGDGNINVTADSEAWMLNATASLPGAIGTAMGGSFNISLFGREASVEMEKGVIDAGKNVRIRSSAKDHSILAGLVMAGSVDGVAAEGNLLLQREKNKVHTTLGDVKIDAGHNALIESYLKDDTKAAAGSVALANVSAAVGLTDLTLDKKNDVQTVLGSSTVNTLTAGNVSAVKNMDGEEITGVYTGAVVREKQLLAGAGVALSGSAGVTATSVNMKSRNKVYMDASAARLRAQKGSTESNVAVKAIHDANQSLFLGGVNFGLAAGVGAGALVLTSDNDVKTLLNRAEAKKKIDILASNNEVLLLMNINAGGSPDYAVEIGATITDQRSKVNAITTGYLHGSDISMRSENITDMTDIAVALGIAGKVAAIPVFVYNGFSGEANALISKAIVVADNNLDVSADSGKTIHQYTFGAAFSKETALSGVVAVNVAKDKTNAVVDNESDLTAKNNITIQADSDYSQFGVTGSVSASNETAATVNGIVNILKASTLAELEGRAETTASGGLLSVNASALRDVRNIAGNVAAGFETGIGITVMVLEAGDHMDEEAAHQLTYGGAKEGEKKAFKVNEVIDHLNRINIDTSAMSSLEEDLESNGQKLDTSKLETGGKPHFDASSGYNSQSTSDEDDGKTGQMADLENAKEIGDTAYKNNPLDSIAARIGGSANVYSRHVQVLAEQETLADLYGATVSVSGEMAGGISFATARLRSNVFATSLGKIDADDGNVTVKAVSKSGEVSPEEGSDEENRMKGILNRLEGVKPDKRSIRAVGLVVSGAGEGSAAISAGGVRLDNITSSTLGGTIKNAGRVTVNSDALYQDVFAATLALSGSGTASVAASIALAVADGTVSSTIDRTANISGKTPKVSVTTNSVVNADSIATAASFGLTAGVIAGLSLAKNNLKQDTIVARGAKISGTSGKGSLTVHGESDTKAEALLMGVSAGTVAVGMGLGIAKLKPTLNTTVGVDGGKETDAVRHTTLSNLGSVNITNTVTGTARADLLAGSLGGVSVAGNVLLVFNDTVAKAKAANVTGSVNGDFTINGKLSATGTSEISAVAAGGASVGVTVNHVDVNAKNSAELNTSLFDLSVGGTLSVTTGEKPVTTDKTSGGDKKDKTDKTVWDTSAIAKSIAATLGGVAIGVNTAVARNRTLNNAIITGSSLSVNNVVLGSYGNGLADAYITGVTEGAGEISVSVVYALNEAKNRAYMNLKGAMNGNLTAESDVQGKTKAHLLTGTGSLFLGVDTNVATARGLTVALTDVRIGAPSEKKNRSISVYSKGKDEISSTIENLAQVTGGLSVATMVGRAFSKDVYDAKLALSGGEYNVDKVSVKTDYTTSTDSDTTPSSSGVKISTVGVAVNKATAKNAAYAGASLSLENATLKTDNDVDILINGNATANAIVHPVEFSFDLGVGVGVNKANAALSGTQAAMLLLGEGGVEKAKNVNIKSLVNQSDVYAAIGGSGNKNTNSVKISAVSVDCNSAKASEAIASTAAVLGGKMKTRYDEVMVDHGKFVKKYKAHFDYDVLFEEEYLDRDENGELILHKIDDLWFIQNSKTGKMYDPFGSSNDIYKGSLPGGFVTKEEAQKAADWLNEGNKDKPWKVTKQAVNIYSGGNSGLPRGMAYGFRAGEHYRWVTSEVMEWEPKLVKVLVPTEYVDLKDVDISKNILEAESLDIYSGVATRTTSTSATARTDGAKSFGLVTVGDLDAKASTKESYNAVLEGVTATITGAARVEARGNASASSLGFVPGGWKAVNGTTTEATAGVGSEDGAQNVRVIIGERSTLKAGTVDLIAWNEGSAKSAIDGDTTVSLLVNVTKSKQPTKSYYNTLITVGKGASLEATSGDVRVLSIDAPKAESTLQSSAFTILVNYNSTKGENEVHQVNNVDFVRDSKITAEKNVVVQAFQTTRALAETKYDGKGFILEGSSATANNTIDRIVRVNVGEGVQMHAKEGLLKLNSFSGRTNSAIVETAGYQTYHLADNIETTAYVESGGFISLANAKAYADVASTSEITVAPRADLKSKRLLELQALSTSNSGPYIEIFSEKGNERDGYSYNHPGIFTTAQVKSSAGIPLPNAVAKTTLNFNTFVNISKGSEPEKTKLQGVLSFANQTSLTSEQEELRIRASNDRLYVQNLADSLGKGAAGSASGNAWIGATLTNAVWIDNTKLSAKTGIDISADTGGMKKGDKSNSNWTKKMINDNFRTHLVAGGNSKLKGIGRAKAVARISGTQINQIRTNNKDYVEFYTSGYESHVASDPTVAVKLSVKANASVPKILGIKLGKTIKKKETEWYYYDRCDFCGTGTQYDVDPTEQEDLEERYQQAYEEALKPINEVQSQVNEYTIYDMDPIPIGYINAMGLSNFPNANILVSSGGTVAMGLSNSAYAKVLVPVGDIGRTSGGTGSATRARYGEEEYLAAGSVFVLDIRSILNKDVRLDTDRIVPYHLWTNSETFHTVYLLPNATQLYVGAGGQPQFAAEILYGDAFGEGKDRYIALYSALTANAARKPVIPIGSTGKLDLLTGTVTVPSFADFELYLHEVSGKWLAKQFETELFLTLTADQEVLNSFALSGARQPHGEIAEGLADGGEKDGWKIYWLGDTPETADDKDQTLLYLMLNNDTDEIDAFRTSVNMLQSGEEPVDVSLYIFRDARSDMMEEEKYDVFFFDTPEGQTSLVKLITNTLDSRDMVMPKALQIVLRAFPMKDNTPAYSLSDSALILTDRQNGKISALGGSYEASYDNDTFDSPYTRIEGISGKDPVVTIKQGQEIWPEKTARDTAETIDGTTYLLIDGVWHRADEASVKAA